MQSALLNQILETSDRPYEDVVVPEWGNVTLRIRAMSGAERDAWERSITRIEDGKAVPVTENFRGRLLVRCIVDPETGERVFKDGHADALGEKSGDVLTRLTVIATRLNKLRAQDVEDLGNGSAHGQSADSGSDSR